MKTELMKQSFRTALGNRDLCKWLLLFPYKSFRTAMGNQDLFNGYFCPFEYDKKRIPPRIIHDCVGKPRPL